MTNLSIHISTVNGTGSLSANQIFTRILFRAGYPVGSCNFFPSNIAGLPCVYAIRINSRGYTSYDPRADILIGLNPETVFEDIKNLNPTGTLLTDTKTAKRLEKMKFNGTHLPLPLTEAAGSLQNTPLGLKKFLRNMIFLGVLCEWLNISRETEERTVRDFFQRAGKSGDIFTLNTLAVKKGRQLGRQNPIPPSTSGTFVSGGRPVPSGGSCGVQFPAHSSQKNDHPSDTQEKSSGERATEKTKENPPAEKRLKKQKKILMDGNTAVALGALSAGCQLLSWYPITPSSSIAESFEKFAEQNQKTDEGKRKYVVLQAEDEISALHHVIGAGWAGLRAMTVTSGPGLSLMAEGAGLAYFAEVPAVLCDVQRAGPSTGLPTRTQQGDLLSAGFLSHGDTSHPILIPGTVEECFSFTLKAFDLAEQTQTLVILLLDLDLGMNLHISPFFAGEDRAGNRDLKRGKIAKREDLDHTDFARYRDEEGDGVSRRALPGTAHFKAGYFTRGSGHNERAQYTENPTEYARSLDKLQRKWKTLKSLVPDPVVEESAPANEGPTAFVTFGNNEKAIHEARDILKERGIQTNSMRIRAFPFNEKVEQFLNRQGEIFIVEQNRDGQLKQLLRGEFPRHGQKMKSVLQYDGRPFFAQNILQQFERGGKK